MAVKSRSTDPAKLAAERVRAYIAEEPLPARRALKAIRAAVRSAVPRAVEAWSYGIPAFKFEGRMLIWYAAWKEHTSVYPITAAMKRAGGTQLAKYAVSKGTVQFLRTIAIPAPLIKRIAKARAAEIKKGTSRR